MRKTKQPIKNLNIVVGCVLDGDEVLLTLRDEDAQHDLHLMWELPGGKLEYRELPQQAVVREIKEETGYDTEVVDMVPHVHTTHWQYDDCMQQALIVAFECRLRGDSGHEEQDDHRVRSVVWKKVSEIDYLSMLPGSREFVWMVAQKHGIDIPNDHPVRNYSEIEFHRIDPKKNESKYYRLSLRLDFNKPKPYMIQRAWGRIGASPQLLKEAYVHEQSASERLLEIAEERLKKGYIITSYSEHSPIRGWLRKHAKSHTKQMTLFEVSQDVTEYKSKNGKSSKTNGIATNGAA